MRTGLVFHARGCVVFTVGVALAAAAAYDPCMIIETLARLTDWAAAQAAESGALAGMNRHQASAAVEAIAGTIWRHAIGQGLRPGDDWGWILEMYGPDRMAEIVRAAQE